MDSSVSSVLKFLKNGSKLVKYRIIASSNAFCQLSTYLLKLSYCTTLWINIMMGLLKSAKNLTFKINFQWQESLISIFLILNFKSISFKKHSVWFRRKFLLSTMFDSFNFSKIAAICKEQRSGGTVNSSLPAWLGCLGCQHASRLLDTLKCNFRFMK